MTMLLNATCFLTLLSISMVCHRQPPVDPQLEPEPSQYLKQSTEARYTSKDSIRITYSYDAQGRLAEEHFGIQPSRRDYSVFTIYGHNELADYRNNNDQLRLNIFNAAQQLISSKKYLARSGYNWSVFESDTMIYEQRQLISQEHRDFYFTADGQASTSNYPLWLTKRIYLYDTNNRISAEVDSVYLMHDFPTGKNYFEQALAAYKFTNRSSYEYNEKNEIYKKTTVSGASEHPLLTFSNSWLVYNQFGPNWSTLNDSWPGRFLSGVTTYQYEYQRDRKLSKKIVRFEDDQTKQIYISVLAYSYYQ